MSHALATVLRDGRRPSAIRNATHPPESVRGVDRKIRNPKSSFLFRNGVTGHPLELDALTDSDAVGGSISRRDFEHGS